MGACAGHAPPIRQCRYQPIYTELFIQGIYDLANLYRRYSLAGSSWFIYPGLKPLKPMD